MKGFQSIGWLEQSEALIYIVGERPLKPPIYKSKAKKKATAFGFNLQEKSVIGSSFKPE